MIGPNVNLSNIDFIRTTIMFLDNIHRIVYVLKHVSETVSNSVNGVVYTAVMHVSSE
jgi:hypothetical protein